MRFEPLSVTLLAVAMAGCPDEKPAAPQPSRFPGVVAKPLVVEEKEFCDRTWPATGDKARPFQLPATKTVAGAPVLEPGKGWRWVNLWATWCTPCVEEMALLSRWRSALEKEGVELSFEMVSIDEAEAEPAIKTWLGRLPGGLTWVTSPSEVPPWLEKTVGINPDSAIPIHILVDSTGAQRCVRVGAVHAQDYGSVRAFVRQP